MLAQQILNGLIVGGVWSLVAIGFTMVYGIIRLMNFAHGDFYMMAAFFALSMINYAHISLPMAFILSIVGTCALAIFVAAFGYRPLFNKSKVSLWLVAVGVSIFLENLAIVLWGAQTQPFPVKFQEVRFDIAGLSVTSIQLAVLLTALVMMVGLHFLVTYTKPGRAMRAVSQDVVAANLMGVKINTIIYFTFGVGALLAAVGGILVGTYYNVVYPLMGYRACLIAFCAAVIGGIGSLPGAMVGGIVLGLVEVLGAAYISAGWRDGYAFLVLIIVLLIKPSGLFVKETTAKV